MCLNAAVYWLKIFSYEESSGFWCCTRFIHFSFRGMSSFLFFVFTTSDCIMLAGSLPLLLVIGVEYLLYRRVSESPFYLIISTHLDFFLLFCLLV